MIKFITIKETGATPSMTARQHGTIMRDVLARVAANHHEKFMFRHFRSEAFSRYGYAPRKGEGLSGKAFYQSYTGRKNKQKGHMKPLVWSGEQEMLAKIRDVRSTRQGSIGRARLIQHARGLNRRNPNSEIRMNEEIRAIAPSEEKEAFSRSGVLLRKAYRELRGTTTKRVG
jgi:hypothetical protein